ncbi:MAG: hypothetical protein A2Y10_12495 [Planctomycetes bacterium GWF2_41_51]|nr:MAG: hypothetical protein A2Y10_12495 [Planctomycetes bacterium GWF2_41_51]HBG27241.1 hypothetical protein [Phycisphaerales bacterium]
MKKLDWQTDKFITFENLPIPCCSDLYAKRLPSLIRKDRGIKRAVKKCLWPILDRRNLLLCNGFIYRIIGKWIRKYCNSETVFLDIGCGNMKFKKYLPKGCVYNAFDVSLSEYHLSRMQPDCNIAIASAADIPLADNSVDVMVSSEVLEHIRGLDQAVDEIYRIARPSAMFFCSIPNNYCKKYAAKGQHPDHVNKFSFMEFERYMKAHGFKTLQSFMMGYWLPICFLKSSYQLPLTSGNEYYNTNFFYMFEVIK